MSSVQGVCKQDPVMEPSMNQLGPGARESEGVLAGSNGDEYGIGQITGTKPDSRDTGVGVDTKATKSENENEQYSQRIYESYMTSELNQPRSASPRRDSEQGLERSNSAPKDGQAHFSPFGVSLGNPTGVRHDAQQESTSQSQDFERGLNRTDSAIKDGQADFTTFGVSLGDTHGDDAENERKEPKPQFSPTTSQQFSGRCPSDNLEGLDNTSPVSTANVDGMGHTQSGRQDLSSRQHPADQPLPTSVNRDSEDGLSEIGTGMVPLDEGEELPDAYLTGVDVTKSGDTGLWEETKQQAHSPGNTAQDRSHLNDHGFEDPAKSTTAHSTHSGKNDDSVTTGLGGTNTKSIHSEWKGEGTDSISGGGGLNGSSNPVQPEKGADYATKAEGPVGQQETRHSGLGPTTNGHGEPISAEDDSHHKPGFVEKVVGYAKKTRGSLFHQPEVKAAGQRLLDGEESQR